MRKKRIANRNPVVLEVIPKRYFSFWEVCQALDMSAPAVRGLMRIVGGFDLRIHKGMRVSKLFLEQLKERKERTYIPQRPKAWDYGLRVAKGWPSVQAREKFIQDRKVYLKYCR